MSQDVPARIQDRTAKVAVLGQGYVGLVVAMRASEAGFPVVGLEVDEVRARRLAAGDSFIEDVPNDVLQPRSTGATSRPLTSTSCPGSTSPSSRCRRPSTTARPTSPTSSRPRA